MYKTGQRSRAGQMLNGGGYGLAAPVDKERVHPIEFRRKLAEVRPDKRQVNGSGATVGEVGERALRDEQLFDSAQIEHGLQAEFCEHVRSGLVDPVQRVRTEQRAPGNRAAAF